MQQNIKLNKNEKFTNLWVKKEMFYIPNFADCSDLLLVT